MYYAHTCCEGNISLTGSIARNAKRGYLIYSEGDFEVSIAEATRCTDGVKFLLKFDQNVEYKRPAGAYPLHDIHKICRIGTSFKDAFAFKVSLYLLKGLWSYGSFNLTGSGYRQMFSAP